MKSSMLGHDNVNSNNGNSAATQAAQSWHFGQVLYTTCTCLAVATLLVRDADWASTHTPAARVTVLLCEGQKGVFGDYKTVKEPNCRCWFQCCSLVHAPTLNT